MCAPADARDAGSISLELVIIAPMLFALLVLMLGYGRHAQVNGLVEAAARDGARVATQSRTYEEAQTRIQQVVADTLLAAPASCRTSATQSVLGGQSEFAAGRPVTVQVQCDLSFSDIGLPLPTQQLTRTFTSSLDPYRGTR